MTRRDIAAAVQRPWDPAVAGAIDAGRQVAARFGGLGSIEHLFDDSHNQ